MGFVSNGGRARSATRTQLVKIRDAVKLLERDGWYLSRQRGSHRQYKHRVRSGLVTVAGKPNDDLAPGTLNSIFKQAGMKP
jgi:predicted RNA binding protein YcfA (HicA-like mRNA interferase family)